MTDQPPGRSRTPSASPSPNLLPTPALSYTSSARSVSNFSSISTQSLGSNASNGTRSSSFSTSRRRGYIRPQVATFAESAKNRESVMSLGSIAHLQYYFARTGLLDGKGGQMAKKKQNGEYEIPRLSLSGCDVLESPIEQEGQLLWEASQEDGEDVMLPPTVSTYSHRTYYIPPPPDHNSLKKDLVDALEAALHALEESTEGSIASHAVDEEEPTQGFYEIQGLYILDKSTLAIRAARLYYTMHPNPARLNSIKSDYQLRRELMSVLDVLKKWAGRKFAGGLREEERLAILMWVSEVGMMIDQETRLEEAERQEREGWEWMDDTRWVGRDAEREINFLSFLLRDQHSSSEERAESSPLPDWQPASDQANAHTDFLQALADGRKLIQMHNTAVRRSKKQFGHITAHHADVAKPYRRAENLRFWLKASDLRWEIKLDQHINVMGVANASPEAAVWITFEDAIMRWSRGVREELIKDWKTDEELRIFQARVRAISLARSPQTSPTREGKVDLNLKIPTTAAAMVTAMAKDANPVPVPL